MTSSLMTVSTMHTLSVLSDNESETMSTPSIPISPSNAINHDATKEEPGHTLSASPCSPLDLDSWITEHQLSDIKDILAERDLCDLQTLTLQSHSFSDLIDSVHSAKPSLVPAVCKALHSLHRRPSSSSLSHRASNSVNPTKPTLKLTDSVTDDAADIEHKDDTVSMEWSPSSAQYQSPQSVRKAANIASTVSVHGFARSTTPSLGSPSPPSASPGPGPASEVESIMERQVEGLEAMSRSIESLKSAYTEQMDRKRTKCTELIAMEKRLREQFEGIISELITFRRKEAARGQELQSKICGLHELAVAVQSEKELETQSAEEVRAVLQQRQRQRAALRMARNMSTRCRSKLRKFERSVSSANSFYEGFVQNEDLSLDDVDVAEYQKLLDSLLTFGRSDDHDHDESIEAEREDSASKMIDMVVAVDAVDDLMRSEAPSIKGVEPRQDLTECILKAKEMRKDHEIISLRAELSKQQQLSQALHSENERLSQRLNENQLAIKSLVEDKKQERERNKLIRMLQKQMGDELAAKEGEQDHWRQIEELSEETHRLRVVAERRTLQIGDLQKLVKLRDDEIKRLKTDKMEYERVLRANAMAHHTNDHYATIEKMEIFQSYGGKQYVEEFCARSKYERPAIDLKHVANWKTGEQIWHCTMEIVEIGMKQQYKSKQKAKAIYQCYQRLAGQVAKM